MLAIEAELKEAGERRGRPKQDNEQQNELLEISENFNEFPQGRTAEIAATKAGFGNENTYRQAKTVTEHATPELGKAVEAELKAIGERRGRPKQDNEQQQELGEIVANWPQFEQPDSGQKTRELAAQKAGFDSEQTYRRAKAVTEYATLELVEAMDQGKVAISIAATSPRANRRWRRPWRIQMQRRAGGVRK